MPPWFRYLDDVALADAAFEAGGATPAELFQASAQAVIEAMADPATVGRSWEKTIKRQGDDLPALLFDWLSDLVYLKDAEGVVFREVSVRLDRADDGAAWRLTGRLIGAPINPAQQQLRGDVKAVTKHLFAVERAGSQWTARVVLDL